MLGGRTTEGCSEGACTCSEGAGVVGCCWPKRCNRSLLFSPTAAFQQQRAIMPYNCDTLPLDSSLGSTSCFDFVPNVTNSNHCASSERSYYRHTSPQVRRRPDPVCDLPGLRIHVRLCVRHGRNSLGLRHRGARHVLPAERLQHQARVLCCFCWMTRPHFGGHSCHSREYDVIRIRQPP